MKALIIGGSSSIGEEIINKFVGMSYEVVFTYNNNEEKAKRICEKNKNACRYIQLDLSDVAKVKEFTNAVSSDFVPDVLVNIAGITADALSLGDISESLTKVHTVNYLSPAIICAQVAQLMVENRKGFIINISSVAAKNPKTGNAAYGSAKAALERFTATLTLEVARFKVRTLCIAPAFVKTPMFDQFAKGKEREVIRSLPLREILAVEDVANTAAAFVQGQIKTTGITISLTNGQPVL